jgi:ubiquinol-cytochrome c reductase subunit 8
LTLSPLILNHRHVLASHIEPTLTNLFRSGSPPQRGIITYSMAQNRQRALAGTAHAAIFNTYRRTKGQILYWAVPMLIGYELMNWASEQ